MAKVKKFPFSRSWLESKIKKIKSFGKSKLAKGKRLAKKAKQKTNRYLGLILVITVIALTLASFLFPKNDQEILKEKLVKNPNDFESHLILAEEFLKNNQFAEAEKALLLAQKISNSEKKVIGKQAKEKLGELWQKKHSSDPKDIQKLISAWEKIVEERPNYRDGWLQLAFLNYKLYQNEKAQAALKKALDLDPNYQPARELERILPDNP